MQLAQRPPQFGIDPLRMPLGLGQPGAQFPRVQPGHGGIVAAQIGRPARHRTGTRHVAQCQPRGRRGERRPARLVVQPGGGEVVGEPGAPPGGGPGAAATGHVGGHRDRLGEQRPRMRAAAGEPALRPAGQDPRVGPALLEHGHLRPGQLGGRLVLREPAGAEQVHRAHEVVVGFPEQASGDQHLGPVGVEDAGERGGLAAQYPFARVHLAQCARQVALAQ